MRLRERVHQTLAPDLVQVITSDFDVLLSNLQLQRVSRDANTAHPDIRSRSKSTSLDLRSFVWKTAFDFPAFGRRWRIQLRWQ
jgi:hypothetical protein